MIDECIHGLDRERCDACSPKAPPTPASAKAPVKRAAARTTTSLRTTPSSLRAPAKKAPATRRSAPAAPAKPVPKIGEQRIFHVTHASNLPAILATGALNAVSTPVVDVSSEEARAARRATTVAGPDSATVAEHVPFYLSPNARLWESMRAGSTDPRLSPAAHGLAAAEFVILVSTVKTVATDEASIVVTDGDAAGPLTRFAATDETWTRLLYRLISDDEPDALLRAEFLIKDSVPFDSVTLIGVPHDRARDAVKLALAGSTHAPRVAVHPPWFAVPTED